MTSPCCSCASHKLANHARFLSVRTLVPLLCLLAELLEWPTLPYMYALILLYYIAADLEALIMSTLASQMAAMQRGGNPAGGAGPSSAVTPVSDEDMAVLPTFVYKRPPTAPAEALQQPSSSANKQEGDGTEEAGSQGAQPTAGSADSNSSTAAPRVSECGSDGALTCPICIEAVQDGEEVLTLPCLHQFHCHCVQPWLKQQGRSQAKCPMCKTPVWE